MSPLSGLLQLQERDTLLDQLRHRRATLVQRAELEQLAAERASVIDSVSAERSQRDELARAQRRLEDEVASVESKAASVEARLYGGGITSPKEAQALQADVESLKRRQRDLEDQELEIMEQLEPLDARLAEVDEALAEVDRRRQGAAAELAAAESALDGENARVTAQRADLAKGLPAGLVETYEGLRTRLGGVAVARLQGTSCQGCHLALSAVDVDRIRHTPPDAIVHCPECTRILVR